MNIIKSNLVTFFDVDDTLIFWTPSFELNRPYQKIVFNFNGLEIEKYIISEHVEELKRQKESGSYIIVWSASGYQWAEAIVKALKIEKYVDVCMSKPIRYYDDKDVSEWMPKRRYYLK